MTRHPPCPIEDLCFHRDPKTIGRIISRIQLQIYDGTQAISPIKSKLRELAVEQRSCWRLKECQWPL